MLRRILAALGLGTIVLLGLAQLGTRVQAAPVDCSVVLCAPCPPGTFLVPTPGNCCRCTQKPGRA